MSDVRRLAARLVDEALSHNERLFSDVFNRGSTLIIGVQPTTKVAAPKARVRIRELVQRKRRGREDGVKAQRHTAGCEAGRGGLLNQQNDR